MLKLKVLVVDDEEELVSILVERLEFRGFEVDGVLGGADALLHSKQKNFDVAVIDVKMPEINGIETLKRLKIEHPNIKVILMTGHGSPLEGIEGMAEGAYDYLVKPVNIEDLVAKINASVGLTT
jgi:DNA-binding response OmpR family regulator